MEGLKKAHDIFLLPPPHDQPYFCALMNSLSIKKNQKKQHFSGRYFGASLT